MRRPIRLTSIISVASLGSIACVCPETEFIRIDPDVQRPDRSVVIFFVDGLDRRRLLETIQEGMLPNIRRRFSEDGVTVDHAIVSLPSTTYPNAVSLITGLFPGHHGILGNRWFDRYTLQNRNYGFASTFRDVNGDFHAPTLYEVLNDRFTVNVQCHSRRGVTCTIDNWPETGLDWFFRNFSGVDRRVGWCIRRVADLANSVGRWPCVYMNYFPGIDEIGHRYGVNSEDYTRALKNVDEAIGRVCNAIHRAGLGGKTYFLLVTDHNHVQRGEGRSFNIDRWLERRCGLRIHESLISRQGYESRHAFMKRFDALLITAAYRSVAIHLKGPDGWSSPPSKEDLQRVLDGRIESEAAPAEAKNGKAKTGLHEQPGVGLVCVPQSPDRVRVIGRRGAFIVERRIHEGRKEYRLMVEQADSNAETATDDPLGYREKPDLAVFLDEGWHDSRAWLAATAATRYPDFVPQVVEMFDSSRAGNIVVFAADDWAFSNTEPSGHGSCLAEDMRVPMYFAGPDLRPGAHIENARLVDVMPTVLDLLGEGERLKRIGPIDGISLKPELLAAKPHLEGGQGARAIASD